MARYTGPIKLVDIGGTVCDGFQDLRHLYPNDDGLPVKGPVIVFEQIFQRLGMDVDWATIRRPMDESSKRNTFATSCSSMRWASISRTRRAEIGQRTTRG